MGKISCKEYVQLMQLIIDNEAAEEEKELFLSHSGKCNPCQQHYLFEKQTIEFLKNKLKKIPTPQDLEETIRQQIKGLL